MATTASKSRSRVMVTPPPKTGSKGGSGKLYTQEEKQQLLDNFDCEVKDKIRSFEAYLTMTVQSLIMHQNSEMFRIPADLRKMTMKQIKETWGGSLGGTVQKMKQVQIEAEERERVRLEEEERKIKEREAAKRKLEEEEISPGRSKNARKDLGKSAGTSKRKPMSTKKSKSAPTRSCSTQPSTLPQNHIFNPLLPPTPKMPRAPRRGESLLSINGSPLAPDAEAEYDSEESGSDDELPDPKAYEARLAKSQLLKSVTKPKPAKTKLKRGPSLMIRQSLAPVRGPVDEDEEDEEEEDDGMMSISLGDGRIITFNPLTVDALRVEDEMRESGLQDNDVVLAREKIKAEAMKALSKQMGRWGI